MSHQVQERAKRAQSTNSNTNFYISVALAVGLILGGMLSLLLVNKTPSAGQVTAGQLATPAPQPALAPDFTLQTLEGRKVKLSDYRGQVVLLNTWATWCPPCRAEMPILEAYYREHKEDGFVVLAVNSQESAGAVATFIQAESFTFPVLLDLEGVVMDEYRVQGLPTSFFIDREGVLREVWSGQLPPARLKELVGPLLTERKKETR